ncbi:hypothetical protein WR25_21076 [Diploscapter pachys]|uniref:Strictosidine synthase conserved region domain-containing protein n=1 Tax=Diploscapter pachys TaxID=2018661 RepID=A0A2A2KFA9_9BILA|nr:hypothetical protein WR25_21076 [Diploscapter pachys]
MSWIALYFRYNSGTATKSYSLPQPPSLTGPLAPNELLTKTRKILEGEVVGPESIVVVEKSIYATLYDGRIIKIEDDKIVKTIVLTKEKNCGNWNSEPRCGRPLGIRQIKDERFLVADAYKGIHEVDFSTGKHEQLVSPLSAAIPQLMFVNDLDVINEDEFVFTDSSSKYDRRHFMNTVLEGVPDGRVFHHKISSGKTTLLVDNLYFANGIQLIDGGKSFVVSECSMARIRKYTFATKKLETFAENLPGLPDNIRAAEDGTLWVGMAGIRSDRHRSMVDKLADMPTIRQFIIDIVPANVMLQLFPYFKPSHSLVLQLSSNGKILRSLHDPTGKVIEDSSQVKILLQ